MSDIVTLTEASIDACFEDAKAQADYVVGLYRLVFPNYDQIASVDGHPACTQKLWTYIADKAMNWDRVHCPGVLPGGAWMNYGFATSIDQQVHVTDLQVVRCPVTLKE